MKKQLKKETLLAGTIDLAMMVFQVITAMAIVVFILYSGLEGNPSIFELSTWRDMFYGFNSRYV